MREIEGKGEIGKESRHRLVRETGFDDSGKKL